MKRNYFLDCFKVYFKKSEFPKFEALSILQALEVVCKIGQWTGSIFLAKFCSVAPLWVQKHLRLSESHANLAITE